MERSSGVVMILDNDMLEVSLIDKTKSLQHWTLTESYVQSGAQILALRISYKPLKSKHRAYGRWMGIVIALRRKLSGKHHIWIRDQKTGTSSITVDSCGARGCDMFAI